MKPDPPRIRDAYPELFRKLRGEPAVSPPWREFWDEFLVVGAPLIVIVVIASLVLDFSVLSLEFAAILVAVVVISRAAYAIRVRRR